MPKTYKRKRARPNESHLVQKVPAYYKPDFLTRMDQRTQVAQMLRERFDSIAADLGGIDTLSNIKASLLEQFVFLEGTLRSINTAIATAATAKDANEMQGRHTQVLNTLMGLARTLGLERIAKTIDLKSYIAGNEQ